MTTRYPGREWERAEPETVGMDPEELAAAEAWLDGERHPTDERFPDARDHRRVVVVRDGRLVAEWNRNVGPRRRFGMASANKQLFSSVLGVAVEEGRIESVDARLEDCYPEALQVLPGEGPKPGRHARRKDRAITLRQLISNTSGYLKPDEAPGEVFHYQTWGMNVLEHAVASTYGLYDVDAPEDNEFERLLTTRLRAPLQGEWEYDLKNFQEHENDHARLEIFGYYTNVFAHALDLARIGWLWRNWGEWGNHRLVPEWWLREATSTVSTVSRPESGGTWEFGQGFWTNSGREMWPDLPADAFAASGMEGGPGSDPDHPIVFSHVWVCPSLDLVVAMSPSPYEHPSTIDRPGGLIERVVAAVEA